MATPLDKISNFKTTRAHCCEILTVMTEMGGEVLGYQDKGRAGKSASTLIMQRCASPTHETTQSNFISLLHKLKDAGWIEVETHGKRTPKIQLLREVPKKYLTRSIAETFDQGESDKFEDLGTPVVEEKEPKEPLLDAELGMRGGRLAARIERAVPELVNGAVKEALGGMMSEMLGALGFYPGMSPEELAKVEAESERLVQREALMQSRIDSLEESNRQLQAIIDWVSDQDDERLLHSNDGQVAAKQGMTVNQLPEIFRRMGRHALEHGWTIRKTRGNHLAWKSPEGRTVFSATTSSSRSVEQLIWRKLKRLGLPDYKGAVQESADEGRWSNQTMQTQR